MTREIYWNTGYRMSTLSPMSLLILAAIGILIPKF